ADRQRRRRRRGRAAARREPARPLQGDPADPAHPQLCRRPSGPDHDLPRPARARLRPRPGAPAGPGQAHRAPRDRAPLRHQRRAARRDRPLLSLELPGFVVCPACHGAPDVRLDLTRFGRAYGTENGIPSLLDRDAPGIEAKLRELAAWPELAKEQGWYETDDRIDAALPFLNRDLGWEDRTWAATEHGFQLLLDRYVRHGDRVLEIGAAKSWASLHLLPRGCEYVACDLVVDPLIGLGRGPFFEARVGPYLRLQADGERLPFGEGTFDVAYCVATLHPALDLQAMVGELARVTRPGGIVAGLNEGTRAPFRSAANPEQEHEKELGINEHVHTMWAYLWAFARAGLRPARLEYAQGPGELAQRNVAGKLLRLGRTPATLWALNAYAYSGLSIYARH